MDKIHSAIMEQYPFVEKCVDCYYWRYLDFPGTQFNPETSSTYAGRHIPFCAYLDKTGELRGCYGGKYCDKFRPKKLSKRQRREQAELQEELQEENEARKS